MTRVMGEMELVARSARSESMLRDKIPVCQVGSEVCEVVLFLERWGPTPMDGRVKRLDSTAQHLGRFGDGRDIPVGELTGLPRVMLEAEQS